MRPIKSETVLCSDASDYRGFRWRALSKACDAGVREELNLVESSRIKTHRIMDFNNHPDTTLDEIHALLRRAKSRVQKEVR